MRVKGRGILSSALSRGRRFLLTAVLVFAATASLLLVGGFSLDDSAGAKTRAQLKEELMAARQGLAQVRDRIAQAEQTRRYALDEVAVLDRRIEQLEQELAAVTADRDKAASVLTATRGELQRLRVELEGKRAQLAKTEADLRRQREALSSRVVGMYKSRGYGYLDLLLSPTGRLTDLVDRLHLIGAIVRQDERILDQIKTMRVRVAAEQAALEAEQNVVAAVEQRQSAEATRLSSLVAKRQGALDRLGDARADKQAIARKAERNKEAWERQEDELLAESDRIESQLQSLGGGTTVLTRGLSGDLIWPVNCSISSPYGYRIHPIFHVRKLHTGVDLRAATGTPIRAAAAGRVVSAGWRGGYGKTIIISHGNGLATLYAHQSVLLVEVGRMVHRGQIIGRVGSTGYSTGPHLHFEVRVNGSPVNPAGYL